MSVGASNIVRISSFGFARGSIVRHGSGPNMLVVRQINDRVVCISCEGDEDGTLRMKDYFVGDLRNVLVTAAEQDLASSNSRS